MARTKRVQYFNNFTGGLNISTPRQSLSLNETPDCLDVDFNARGGFTLRKGVSIAADVDWSALDGGKILGSLSFGTDLLLATSSTYGLLLWDGSSLTTASGSLTDSAEPPRFATWGSKAYFANCWTTGNLVSRSRAGASLGTVTTLAQTFNDDYTTPVGGVLPLARLVAQHSGYLWVADTVESSTRHRSRVRWSHPLQPEDWATADYFDLDPDDETDEITALVPFKNMLVVFKKNSVWAIFGTGSDSFIAERVASAGGVAAQEAVTVSSGVCYWWSPDGNLFAFDGSKVYALGDRIRSVMTDEGVDPFGAHAVCWAAGVLWVSLEKFVGGHVVFVFDPSVGRGGSWTRYSLSPPSLWFWNTDTVDALYMTLDDQVGLFSFGNDDQMLDEFTFGVETPIPAYYCTSWFSGGETALKKRFRRMRVTAAARAACDLTIDVFYDFKFSPVGRTLSVPISASDDPGMVWGSGLWGEPWGGAGDEYAFERTSSGGRGHAVMWKFYVTDAPTRWWVDSFTIPYFEKGR